MLKHSMWSKLGWGWKLSHHGKHSSRQLCFVNCNFAYRNLMMVGFMRTDE